MSIQTVIDIDEVVANMEMVYDLLDLLSGKEYHPFGGPQSYLPRVKEYHDGLDEAGKNFVRTTLVWLRDKEPPARVIEYFRHCVEKRQEATRQWLDRLNVQVPSEIMDALTESPTEEKCRQGLKEEAAYALRLIDESGS